MRRFEPRLIATAALAVHVMACGSDATRPEPPVATAIEVTVGPPPSAPAGLPLAAAPAFVVKDQRGRIMEGVPVAVSVSAGGGTLADAPARTVAGGTPVGLWTLGPTAQVNELTITVAGLPPARVSVSGVPGEPAKLAATTPVALEGRVGEEVVQPPGAIVSDAFDNPITGAVVTVTAAGGGTTASETVTSDAQGAVVATGWKLGTTKGPNSLTMSVGSATATFTAMARPGPLSTLGPIAGVDQAALGGTELALPVQFRLADQYGNGVGGQEVAFAVVAGGGSVAAPSAVSGEDGVVTAPAWRLGRSAIAQRLRSSAGALASEVAAGVRSEYDIDVRFFGAGMTAEQQALFTTAAARLRAAIVGDVAEAPVTNVDLGLRCGVPGLPALTERIDDVVIYASVGAIDGPGAVIAQGGACAFRPSTSGYLPAIGVMKFDVDDLARLTSAGTLQDVMMHEMLHVVGFGTTLFSVNRLFVDYNLSTVGYVGPHGRQGCVDSGGAAVCGVSVPLENQGGPGTANSHWRETVFGTELMTGYSNVGAMPVSRMTVGALADLGYQVNLAAADAYQVPGAAMRVAPLVSEPPARWELGLPTPGFLLTPSGQAEALPGPP